MIGQVIIYESIKYTNCKHDVVVHVKCSGIISINIDFYNKLADTFARHTILKICLRSSRVNGVIIKYGKNMPEAARPEGTLEDFAAVFFVRIWVTPLANFKLIFFCLLVI